MRQLRISGAFYIRGDFVSKKPKRNYAYLALKRLFDIIVALIGCVFLLLFFVIVKITYMLHGDFHTIFLRQERFGKNGKVFKIWKIRTMVPHAEEKLEDLLAKDKQLRKEYQENKKLENDPRVTKMGHYFRRSSIDELPQLINVLTGSMSLVGNRPYLIPEKADMNDKFDIITSVKPGITGWWQVNGRNNVSFKKRLELEEYYAAHQSFCLDCKIFFRTFSAVITRKGAQ